MTLSTLFTTKTAEACCANYISRVSLCLNGSFVEFVKIAGYDADVDGHAYAERRAGINASLVYSHLLSVGALRPGHP